MTISRVTISLVCMAAMFTQACTTAQITLSLQTAALAAETALASASPPTPGTQSAITYIAEASEAINQVGTILGGSGTPATKAADVTAALAGIIAKDPHLPIGTPQRVVTAVATLAQAMRTVLATYGQPPALPGLAATMRVPQPSTGDLQKAAGSFRDIARKAQSTGLRARQTGT